jgi:hypothetical protein
MVGYSLIMIDQLENNDEEFLLLPIWIIGANKEAIRTYIGKPVIDNEIKKLEDGMYGIYVIREDFERINHAKPYIFTHEAEISKEDIDQMMKTVEEKEFEEKFTFGQHYHFSINKVNNTKFSKILGGD